LAKAITVYNTMSDKKEPFSTIQPGVVKMFVCGPTVQGLMHMGHARTYIFYDTLARYLAHLGNKVVFIINITDVDERISDAANAAGVSPGSLAKKFTKLFLEDMRALGINTVTSYEKVSDYIPQAMKQIDKLIAGGHAYAVDGWVYFDVSTFPNFGKLSRMSRQELSLRPLELSLKKRNLLDFSLWRPESLVKDKWRSPWGLGSPGWHIQDTAITLSKLGPRYDIHGGAYELIYPHHEAEIAQGESLTGEKPLVRYWIHTRLVNTNGEKMSKSAGNIYAVRDALKKYGAQELRYFFLEHHYRDDVGLEGLADASKEYRKVRRMAARMTKSSDGDRMRHGIERGHLSPFYSVMNDDMDTPKALVWLNSVLRNHELDPASLEAVSDVLGLDLVAKP
jgi:cysteinyl-tRNA synthetase